jgi:phosphoribosylaminoimidazole-succinocarboxamide synthase
MTLPEDPALRALGPAVASTALHSLPLIARGKVRDLYAVGSDRMLMVASDRLSAFDVVMKAPVPGKGRLLTQMALFWFDKLHGIVPNHLSGERPESVVAADEGPQIEGRCRARPSCAATWPARAGRNTSAAALCAGSPCRVACR